MGGIADVHLFAIDAMTNVAPPNYSGNPNMRAPSANLSAIDRASPIWNTKPERQPGSSSCPRRKIGMASAARPASASAIA